MEGNKVFSNISKKIKQLANVVPKVDALGPEIEYIPKKIEVNKPMPDLKMVTCKIDNEGLEIVHLPKEVKVHKGTPKFDNLQARVDNKGIEILHGQTPAKVLQKFAISEPEPETLPEEPEQSEEKRKTEILPGPINSDEVFTLPQTVSSPYVVPEVSPTHPASRVSTPSPSSSSSEASLPPTPRAEISTATLRQLFSSQGSSHHLSPGTSARVSPRSRVPTPPPRSPSPKPKLATPPESPEIILRPILKPPRKVKTPTPPPSKLIQVSPVKYQGLFVQTDSVDKFDGSNQTDFAEPKKNSGLKWWKWLLLILILLLIFIGVGVAIGYAVGFFGKSKLRCSDGFERVGNLCQPLTSSSTPEPCDGCNCPLDILLDPGLSGSGGDTAEVTSPRYPKKYNHNSDCTWNIMTTSGQLELTFTRFNLEWAQNCRDKDYVFLDQVERYGRMWLCGPFLPSSFLTQTSKFKKMTVKFRSNGSVTRLGFRAVITAIASSVPDLISHNPDLELLSNKDGFEDILNFTSTSTR